MISIQRVLSVVLALAATSAALPAMASYLYWTKSAVKTDTEVKCLRLAHDVIRQSGYQGTKSSATEVTGSKSGVFVAITCVARGGGQNAIAVVMTMGDADAATMEIRDQIVKKLSGIQFID